jgi:hypothetical protein
VFFLAISEKKIEEKIIERKKKRKKKRKHRENNKMEFSFTNLFEFIEDTSRLWASLWERFVSFTTPYILLMFDYGIRTYLWIQDLPFFQQKKCKYAEILSSDSWNYTGFLVHTKTVIPFGNEYTMIHHYDKNQNQDPNQVKCENTDIIDTLYMIQNQNVCICNRNAFVFVKPEKSKIRFLYVEFIHKGNTVSLDVPDEMMQVGNKIFTPAFIYRLLDHSSRSFLFDLNYRLIIVDEQLNSTNLDSGKYLLLEKTGYRVQPI